MPGARLDLRLRVRHGCAGTAPVCGSLPRGHQPAASNRRPICRHARRTLGSAPAGPFGASRRPASTAAGRSRRCRRTSRSSRRTARATKASVPTTITPSSDRTTQPPETATAPCNEVADRLERAGRQPGAMPSRSRRRSSTTPQVRLLGHREALEVARPGPTGTGPGPRPRRRRRRTRAPPAAPPRAAVAGTQASGVRLERHGHGKDRRADGRAAGRDRHRREDQQPCARVVRAIDRRRARAAAPARRSRGRAAGPSRARRPSQPSAARDGELHERRVPPRTESTRAARPGRTETPRRRARDVVAEAVWVATGESSPGSPPLVTSATSEAGCAEARQPTANRAQDRAPRTGSQRSCQRAAATSVSAMAPATATATLSAPDRLDGEHQSRSPSATIHGPLRPARRRSGNGCIRRGFSGFANSTLAVDPRVFDSARSRFDTRRQQPRVSLIPMGPASPGRQSSRKEPRCS